MLMEAMRLSLLDHEEHQRKEAEEKKKQEAAATATAAAAGMIQGSDGPGPSTLEGRQSHFGTSSSLSSASSISRSASPSILTHTKVGSQDSLTPNKRSWSFSRCRTTPPPPSSAGPSALNSSPAELLAATTSSNGHERWASRSITPEPGNRNPASFQPSGARRASLDNSMPIITPSNDRKITPRVSDENNNTKPSVPFSNVNILDQQTPSTSQTTRTSTSMTNELGPGGYLSLSRPHLPSLDFEANEDSSKSHLINANCQSQCWDTSREGRWVSFSLPRWVGSVLLVDNHGFKSFLWNPIASFLVRCALLKWKANSSVIIGRYFWSLIHRSNLSSYALGTLRSIRLSTHTIYSPIYLSTFVTHLSQWHLVHAHSFYQINQYHDRFFFFLVCSLTN